MHGTTQLCLHGTRFLHPSLRVSVLVVCLIASSVASVSVLPEDGENCRWHREEGEENGAPESPGAYHDTHTFVHEIAPTPSQGFRYGQRGCEKQNAAVRRRGDPGAAHSEEGRSLSVSSEAFSSSSPLPPIDSEKPEFGTNPKELPSSSSQSDPCGGRVVRVAAVSTRGARMEVEQRTMNEDEESAVRSAQEVGTGDSEQGRLDYR